SSREFAMMIRSCFRTLVLSFRKFIVWPTFFPLISFVRQRKTRKSKVSPSVLERPLLLPQFSMVHSDPKEFERPDYF
ncbi:hypothetical protein PFISCL1PPCAC_20536, partial [Pristionchus fissidentatus]